MRKYALVILDNYDKIQDRYELNLVTNPQGNGFKLKMSLIKSDIEDIVTKVVQDKQTIKFTINQYLQSYQKARILKNWIQQYTSPEFTMALEYDDGTGELQYCEGRVTLLSKTEMDNFGVLAQSFEFTPTTPFFAKRENVITIQKSSVGKKYPFHYPYQYGKSEVINNDINNIYISDVPLIVQINGIIQNPTIILLDEDGNQYIKVAFNGIRIDANETLVINSAQRKIFKKDTNGNITDMIPEVNPQFDTFLRAKSGNSKLSINTNDAAEGFLLKGSWRQYTL